MGESIGAGGWAYFDVPGEGSLTAYSRAFDFVEVNNTFYETPGLAKVKSWRAAVPPDFEFSLRIHRSVGDKAFAPTEANRRSVGNSLAMARALGAQFLHLLWPQRLAVDTKALANLKALMESVDAGNHTLCLEVRGAKPGPLPGALVTLMEDLGMVHTVDLSRETPQADSSYLYTRLFGKGEGNRYQFTNAELEAIADRAQDVGARRVAYTFHGVRMYKDAARFKTFRSSGKFPPVTSRPGLEGLREAMAGEAKFPARRGDLLQAEGWKVIEVADGGQVRAADLLARLPEGTYRSVDDVVRALGPA